MFARVNATRIIVVLLAVSYVSWSVFTIIAYRKSLQQEKQRIYYIGYNFEQVKSLIREKQCEIDIESIKQSFNGSEVTRVNYKDDPPAFMKPGYQHYILTYDQPSLADQRHLDIYSSDLLLYNYLSVIVDKRGRLQEMSWDKP